MPDLVAHEGKENSMNWSIFRNKTGRVIITMGMPVTIYRFWYGAMR
jgi:hypothetical protein